MAQPIVSLLWADDECEGLLNPLSWQIDAAGFRLVTKTNFSDAREVIRRGGVESLLADIILPHASGTGTLRSNVGIELAEFAAQHGVRAVSFLTVVLQSEVEDKFEQLRVNYRGVRFQYFDKLVLLEPHVIDQIFQSLR